MARTYRHLWAQVTSWENLVAAYRRCRRRKRYRQPATEFDFAWEENLLRLQRDLLDGSYAHGAYYHFHITDPKPRKISAAPFRDRIVHHALVSVLEPIFERQFVFDSYACRLGKGTHRAIRRAQHFQRRFPWCLKTDIVRFFPNVDHQILLGVLTKRIADEKVVRLIELIVRSGEGVLVEEATQCWFPGDDLLAVLRPKGLPIGNLTSQFFANVFLDPVDHFIKEQLRIPGYVRYADDLLLFGDSRDTMWEASRLLSEELRHKRLQLHPDKTHVSPTLQPITFLGLRVAPNELRLSQQSIHRFSKRIRRQKYAFAQHELDFSDISSSLHAWLAHCKHTNSSGVRKCLAKHLGFRRGRQTQPSPKTP